MFGYRKSSTTRNSSCAATIGREGEPIVAQLECGLPPSIGLAVPEFEPPIARLPFDARRTRAFV